VENPSPILIGKGETAVHLLPSMANRHGLIAGATGTGKTVTLQVLAEGFSHSGVPVFLADVKGDLSGLSQAGESKPKLLERAQRIGVTDFRPRAWPTVFWDLLGVQGHPIRATVSDMGPLLLARLLDLNDTQAAVLDVAFKLADDEGLLLLDLDDLRSLLTYVSDNAKTLKSNYGHLSSASVGAIQRSLLTLEHQGAAHFFGEPALNLDDLMRRDASGQGTINILAADRLMQTPKVYATFLLWLLAELFEELPEVGDLPQPKLVFFFDEAHLLFAGAPKALIQQIEQVVRLIRSKGVGVYFVTQNPLDIPDAVLGQLGNRVQHALRAFTPRDQKAVRAAAQTLRANPALDTEAVISELGVGEALVSLLDDKGTPGIVQRALICPPASRIGPASMEERQEALRGSPLRGLYDERIDRESAHERLQARAQQSTASATGTAKPRVRDSGRPRQGLGEAFAKSMARSVGGSLGRQILRGVLGAIFKGR
jgi:uncharacterized protein